MLWKQLTPSYRKLMRSGLTGEAVIVDATEDRGDRKHLESAAHRKWLVCAMANPRAGQCIEDGNPKPAAALGFKSRQFLRQPVVEARICAHQTCPARQGISDESGAGRFRKFTPVGHPNRSPLRPQDVPDDQR